MRQVDKYFSSFVDPALLLAACFSNHDALVPGIGFATWLCLLLHDAAHVLVTAAFAGMQLM